MSLAVLPSAAAPGASQRPRASQYTAKASCCRVLLPPVWFLPLPRFGGLFSDCHIAPDRTPRPLAHPHRRCPTGTARHPTRALSLLRCTYCFVFVLLLRVVSLPFPTARHKHFPPWPPDRGAGGDGCKCPLPTAPLCFGKQPSCRERVSCLRQSKRVLNYQCHFFPWPFGLSRLG